MVDVEVTLNNSGESITYRGYVINSCDNSKVYDGTWSPTSATGMTVNASESNITITHNNTSTSDVSSTFTWTSSKVSGCSKTLKVTAKGKTATYVWYISTDNGSTWSESSGFNITLYKNDNNNYGVEGFVLIAHCTGSDMSDCASTFTIKNTTNITSSRSWGLSDLRGSSSSNNVFLRTDSGLVDDLKNSDTGTYTISGEIVSSLDGSSFPVTVNYEVTKKEYIIIFKKNDLTIESVESKPMPKIYTFDVYYRPKDSFEEQSASGIIMSVSSSSTYYTPTFKFTSNTVTLAQNISDGDVIPDDIEFDVKVCIKPSDVSSNICNSLPVHFINKSPIVSEKISVTIKWSISCSNNLMLYQNNTSIDVDLNNEVNSSNTSGSITKTYISGTTSTNISINFSMKGAGYSGNNNYKGKKVITAISCNSIMDPSSKSGTYTGCCLSETGAYIMFTNGGINCTSTFNNVAISDGDTIFIDINLGIGV